MSFRTRQVIFITPFYIIFQFFLLKYIFLLMGNVSDIYLAVLAVLIGLIHFIPMFFEAQKSTPFGRFLLTVDGIWMWASVMFLIDIVAIYLIGVFVPIPKPLVYVMLLIVPILGVYSYHNANDLKINEKTLKLDNLAHDINVVHLSDVHFGSVHYKKNIHNVASGLRQLEDTCDLAVISGDLADGSCRVEEDDLIELGEVNMPIIFTPGNHDYYREIDEVIRACKKAGIIVLDNGVAKFDCLNIFGLSYSFEDRSVPEIDSSKIDRDYVNIISYHVPYYWEEFSSAGFDIQLSGHTHGGQFYPVIWFAELIFKYNMGLFKNDSGKYLHVSTGVGSMNVPMRWGTDSELVVLKLRKGD